MKHLKYYLWAIPFVGTTICLIALFTPAAFFENIVWNHEIYNWIWGYFYEKLPLGDIVSRFYTDPLQLISSLLASIIIITCILIVIMSNYKNRNDLKKGIVNPSTLIIPSILIIITTSMWMILMEIAELQLYDISMWNRYIAHFGVIGMFIGAGLNITGFFLIKKFFSS